MDPGAFAAAVADLLHAGIMTIEQAQAELANWPPEIPTEIRDAVATMLAPLLTEAGHGPA
jgi:hypothetical protein